VGGKLWIGVLGRRAVWGEAGARVSWGGAGALLCCRQCVVELTQTGFNLVWISESLVMLTRKPVYLHCVAVLEEVIFKFIISGKIFLFPKCYAAFSFKFCECN